MLRLNKSLVPRLGYLLFAIGYCASAPAQPTPTTNNQTLMVNKTTGAIVAPVNAATFAATNNLAPTTGNLVLGANGGTGVANTGKTITLGGNLTTNGAFNIILTATANSTATLPTTGTLATLAGAETLTNKTYNGLTITTTTGTLTVSNGKTFAVSENLTLTGTSGASLNIGGGGTLGTGAFQPQTVLTGTANQITVSNGGVGTTTISIPTNPTLPGNATVSGNLTVSGAGTHTLSGRTDLRATSEAPSLSAVSGKLALTQPDLLTSLQFGGYGTTPYALWMQGTNNAGTAFPIALNPIGSYVNIGTSAAQTVGTGGLYVAGNVATGGNLTVTGTAVSTGNSANSMKLRGGDGGSGTTALDIQNAVNGASTNTTIRGDGAVIIKGTSAVTAIRTATLAIDLGNFANGATLDFSIPLTGAAVGDSVHLGPPSTLASGVIFCGWVGAANQVNVRLYNASGGNVDMASMTWRATVMSF